MGEDDAVMVAQNSCDGEDSSPSPPPPHLSSKVLTLPTVLTLGRVAAVPILVASTFRSLKFPVSVLLVVSSDLRHCCDNFTGSSPKVLSFRLHLNLIDYLNWIR